MKLELVKLWSLQIQTENSMTCFIFDAFLDISFYFRAKMIFYLLISTGTDTEMLICASKVYEIGLQYGYNVIVSTFK